MTACSCRTATRPATTIGASPRPEDFAADIDGSAQPKPPSAYKVVGQPVPRRDLIAKVTGAAFIHDIVRPDMLHARMLRQPSREARLTSLNEPAIRKAAGADPHHPRRRFRRLHRHR